MSIKSFPALALIVLLVPASLSQSNNTRKPNVEIEATSASSEPPLTVGERLTYEVSWADFVVAGELTLETRERGNFDGVDAFRVTAQAQSIGLVNAIVYKVDDLYESFIDASTLQPFRANKSTRHGKKRNQTSLTLDQVKRTARFGEEGRIIPIPQNTYDVASLYYAIRQMDLSSGKSRSFTLIEDGNLYDIKAEPEGREKLTTRTGNYDVVKIATRAVRSGAARDPYQLKFYITNDARRLPVLMTAEPSWGSVRMELTSVTGKR